MPRFDAGDVREGPGWGCSCRAWHPGEPTPEQALAALARSQNVTVEFVGAEAGFKLRFMCWTDPDDRYGVTFKPSDPGGWCKHVIACLSHFAPWHRQMAIGADDLLQHAHRLEVRNRKLERSEKRLLKKLKGRK